MAEKITIQRALESATPNNIADLARATKLGKVLSTIKVVVTGLTAASVIDITAAATKAAATISGVALNAGEGLPAIGQVVSLRVSSSGTAGAVGTYGITDSGGTAIVPPGGASAAMGIAKLSDDGAGLCELRGLGGDLRLLLGEVVLLDVGREVGEAVVVDVHEVAGGLRSGGSLLGGDALGLDAGALLLKSAGLGGEPFLFAALALGFFALDALLLGLVGGEAGA